MTEERVRIFGLTCVVTECITCGLPFTVPLTVYEQHRKRGGYHHCPNGHQQGWSADRSQEGKERKELDRLRQQQAMWDEERRQLQATAETERRRTAAARGQVTKLKKRAAAGVCPCCNRTFQDLSRHMAGQHPEFMTQPDEASHVH
jgi:hypothetical protein